VTASSTTVSQAGATGVVSSGALDDVGGVVDDVVDVVVDVEAGGLVDGSGGFVDIGPERSVPPPHPLTARTTTRVVHRMAGP
jgi:hypothetical protein